MPHSTSFRWLLGFSLLLSSCSTQQDYQLHLLHQTVYSPSENVQSIFEKSYRSSILYSEYRTELQASALFKSMDYRSYYVQSMQESYLLGKPTAKGLLNVQSKQYENEFEFLILVYGGSLDHVKLGKDKSHWRIYLKDDDGDLLSPISIRKLGAQHREVVFLKKYIDDLDRWVQVYRVKFPKLNKTTLQQAPGEHPFELILTSLDGKVILAWNNTDLFYSPLPQPQPKQESVTEPAAPPTSEKPES